MKQMVESECVTHTHIYIHLEYLAEEISAIICKKLYRNVLLTTTIQKRVSFSHFSHIYLSFFFFFFFTFKNMPNSLLFIHSLYFFRLSFPILQRNNGLGDLGSIPSWVMPKTQKMVLDASLLNTQRYKVQIKSKVEQSRERSSTLPYTLV